MRLSIDPDDPGYSAWKCYGLARVFLDGVERKNVITADQERNYITVTEVDDRGVLKLEGDKVKTVAMYGKVEIKPLNDLNFPSNPEIPSHRVKTLK